MDFAACFPAAIASIIDADPDIASPPAKTPHKLVFNDNGSTDIVLFSLISTAFGRKTVFGD